MSRTVHLTERRPRTVRLPRAEVDFLLGSARHLIEIVPAFQRGAYTLTPRGYVGFFTGPTTRYAVRPKIPWPNLRLLLGLGTGPAGEAAEPDGGLLAVLATGFAERLEEVTRAGLVPGYGEVESKSRFLRGKLRPAAQMRDGAAQAFPGLFHIDEPVFDLDTPWNQIVQATATALLRRSDLSHPLRERVAFAARPLTGVSEPPATAALFDRASAEPRAAGYRPLLDVCRMIQHGLASLDPGGNERGAFLLDLGRAFEYYLTAALRNDLASHGAWALDAQPGYVLGPTTLQPDLVLRERGVARVVLDAKWKTTALDPHDVHQVLAYAALTGAPHVGLVYPGRSDARASFATPDGTVRVTRYRLRVVGTGAELVASVARLGRAARRP